MPESIYERRRIMKPKIWQYRGPEDDDEENPPDDEPSPDALDDFLNDPNNW